MAKAKGKENAFFTGMESFEDTTALAPEMEEKAEVKAEIKVEEPNEEKAPAPEKTVPLPQVKKEKGEKDGPCSPSGDSLCGEWHEDHCRQGRPERQ